MNHCNWSTWKNKLLLFIVLYAFVLLWNPTLQLVHCFSEQHSKYGEREMEYIFAIVDGGYFIPVIHSSKKLSEEVYVCLSSSNK